MAPQRTPVMRPRPVSSRFLFPRIAAINERQIFANYGPETQELESRLAETFNVSPQKVVCVSNATLGLCAAIVQAEVRKWLAPGWTFPATVLAPLQVGHSVVLADIDDKQWLLQDQRESADIGLIPVIPFGGSFDRAAWSQAGEVVVDAAASLATKPDDLQELPPTASIVFSLHATKTIGGAEGGVVVFGSEERAERARGWINFGFTDSRSSDFLGTNAKMSEYDAAVANARLDGWETEESEWRNLRHRVRSALGELGTGGAPDSTSVISPYWIHLFDSPHHASEASSRLSSLGIETRAWWGRGIRHMPAFRDVMSLDTPVLDDIARRYLGLPFFLGISDEEIELIVQVIAETRDL